MTRSKRKNAYIAIAIIGVLAIIGVTFASIFRAQKESELSIYPVSLNATMQMSESLDDVVIGETVIDKISFTRNNDSLDSFVRIGVSYYKDGALTDDDKRFLLGANYEDITTSSDGSTYMWTRGEDGYYYLTDLSGNPIKVASTSEYVFCENVAYTGAPSLYQTIPAPTGLKLKADIQAINAKSLTTPSIDELSTVFLDNFGSEPVYGYIVTFDTGDANAIVAQTFLSINQTVTKPSDPILMGHDFMGWYTDSSFQNIYNFDTPVTSSFTLYAKLINNNVRILDESNSVLSEIKGGNYKLEDIIISNNSLQNKYNFYRNDNLTQPVLIDDILTGGDYYALKTTEGFTYSQIMVGTAANQHQFIEEYMITGYSGADSNIIIPNNFYVNGVVYPITKIQDNAFSNKTNIESVFIPEGIKNIGYGAFYGCSNLNEVNIPSTVEFVDSSVLIGTAFLSGQTDNLVLLDGWCMDFNGDSSVTEITLPANCVGIASNAFYGASYITKIDIPNGVKYICESAFWGCNALNTINIPASVERVSARVLHNTEWYNGQSDGVLYLDNWCLGYKGAQPQGVLTLDVGCVGIADSSFMQVSSINGNLVIPESVKYIGSNAFQATYISSVTLPSSLDYLGDCSFYMCEKLIQVKNNSTQIIDGRCFQNTNEDFTILASNEEISVTISSDGKYYICTYTDKIYLLGFVDASDTLLVDIPTYVTHIYRCAFFNSSITEATIGANIKEIYPRAFSRCAQLGDVTFEITTGWYYTSTAGDTSGGTALTISATDTAANATLLKSTYASYYWYRV